jgi:hypothetical protein
MTKTQPLFLSTSKCLYSLQVRSMVQ